MPSDEYASAAAGGALRLKGAKVEKHKSKKHKKRSREDRERRAERADGARQRQATEGGDEADAHKSESKTKGKDKADETDDGPYARMTPAERRFAEAQDRKIRDLMNASPEEARAAHPELFKTHKERLADLNTYLSRMSEHHDMPKIGPG